MTLLAMASQCVFVTNRLLDDTVYVCGCVYGSARIEKSVGIASPFVESLEQ